MASEDETDKAVTEAQARKAECSAVIATATVRGVVYLPHLDYDLQRLGPDHPGTPARVAEVDRAAGLRLRRNSAERMPYFLSRRCSAERSMPACCAAAVT